MINKDVQKMFNESIKNLIDIAHQKWDEAQKQIDQKQKFNQECNEAKNTMSDAINHIGEILDLDLTTHEGYSKYMEYLGNLRNRTKEYDGFLKAISGKTAAEIIDEIAQKATTFYEENRKEKNETTVRVDEKPEFKKTNEETKKEIVEQNNPSDGVDDSIMASINRIVDRYVNESLLPSYDGKLRDRDRDWLIRELVEYSCWLNQQYPA